MFCTKCGKPNNADNSYCVECGNKLNELPIPQNRQPPAVRKDQIEAAYYQANLKMQQDALYMQQQQLIEQQRQYAAIAKCPRCGSTSLSGNKKGYGIGKGVVGGLAGAFIAGPIGLIGLTAGNMGAKKVIVTCMKCGKKFKM